MQRTPLSLYRGMTCTWGWNTLAAQLDCGDVQSHCAEHHLPGICSKVWDHVHRLAEDSWTTVVHRSTTSESAIWSAAMVLSSNFTKNLCAWHPVARFTALQRRGSLRNAKTIENMESIWKHGIRSSSEFSNCLPLRLPTYVGPYSLRNAAAASGGLRGGAQKASQSELPKRTE